ncbi:MAG TPA: 4-aminobutyrate--2-oxoglutarate transaminase [Candidatus Dormibacteraeota bacterium]|jgi:4-aminobutyrate aminotransferase/(S)-3-amino-2-methylpropionate transaminase|nr:4-aminobutyrate--2-oxoglutarate transaminase [Candidatus Dormibacteraeota bacterium]
MRNAELQKQRESSVARGMGSTMAGFAHSAEGASLVDADGRTYVDFASGISVTNLGHGHPEVLAAIHAQVDLLINSGGPVMLPDVYVALCARLCALAPVPAPARALLVNSGAEAVENAVKIVRQATGRPAIISFHNSFHGRTLMAMSLTGKVHPYKQNFGPYAPEVYQVPYPYAYHDQTADESLDALQSLFASQVPPDRVAGVIVEPVQGEGGFVVPPPDFLPRLARLLRELEIPLIADEIQTGVGRTGEVFAVSHFGVEPDLVLLAKSLGGGLPLAAVVGRAELMDAPAPGGLGGTFGGNPVACAAALAVLDVIERDGFLARARQVGAIAIQRMQAMQERHACIGDVRGVGAMTAMELVDNGSSREPAPALTAAVLREAHSRGLVVLRAGLYDNVIRLLMPLTISDEELTAGLDILAEALDAALATTTTAEPAATTRTDHGN